MYPPNDILARMRRRRVLEPPVGSTPPIALEQDAEMGRSDPWSERLPDGRTVNEAVMETLRRSSQPRYRGSDRPEEQDDRIMRLPASGEVVVGEGGKIEGFGTQRDYEPLAGVNREAILEALKRGTAVPLGGNQTRTAHDTAIPLGSSSTPSSAVPLGGKTFGSGFPAPDEQEFAGGQETRPAIVGGSRDPNPLTREAARIRTMLEHPSRKVSSDGSAGTSEKLGRWKAIGLGLLHAGSRIRPGASTAEALTTLGTGGIIGAVSPGSIQGWDRRIEAEGAQDRLAQQIKLLGGQAQLENMQANTAETRAGLMPDPDDPTKMIKRPPKRAPQYVERSDGVYEISEGYPNGRRVANIPAEVKTARRGSVHYEPREDGVYAIYEDETGALKSTKVEGVPGKPASDAQAAQAAEGEAIAETTQAAADDLKAELDQQKGQLLENERAITAKEAWWNSQAQKRLAAARDPNSPEFNPDLKLADILAELKANDPDFAKGEHDTLLNNTKALRDAVADKEKQIRDMAADVRKGSAKAARGSRRAPYRGRTMSAANLERYAKDKGISVEEARQRVEAQGIKVR